MFAGLRTLFLPLALVALVVACGSDSDTRDPDPSPPVQDPANDPSPGDPVNEPDTGSTGPLPNLALVDALPNVQLQEPVAAVQAPGDPQHWYIVEKAGTVQVVDTSVQPPNAQTFIDISDRVVSAPSEAGLLGIAFDPDYLQNGRVFLSYTGENQGQLTSYVSVFTRGADPMTLDPASEAVILSVPQPHANHNGGHIAFGLDGNLYIGFGDGGGSGDQEGNAQNTNTLLGALLRIDVRGAPPYTIPQDNPLASGGGRGELYAWGFRNPWRWSFDRANGDLWVGDVGGHGWEEIDLVQKGGNYGWPIREGAHCFSGTECPATGLIDPVAEYTHGTDFSVTGGYVYRGAAIPALDGVYLYGDFGSGKIWGLRQENSQYVSHLLLDSEALISSFAESADGELYVVDFARGKLYQVTAAQQ